MDSRTGTSDADARANQLYWGSDRSVNQIADDLDLSKGALYELIRPQPAGFGCPLCGHEVVYSNRTAKERERVDCAACGWDGAEDEAIPFEGRVASPPRTPRADPSSDDLYSEDDFDAPGPPPVRFSDPAARGQRLIIGGALLGAAVGLALVIWARRK